ncbi:MAG: hypothetical protein LBB56_02555 [Chitinispirillales bacterium]|jgi:hypothetical protein|nr:hypothetical protein [Chitinispirillales bacterium]
MMNDLEVREVFTVGEKIELEKPFDSHRHGTITAVEWPRFVVEFSDGTTEEFYADEFKDK